MNEAAPYIIVYGVMAAIPLYNIYTVYFRPAPMVEITSIPKLRDHL